MFECKLISLIPCSKTQKHWKSAKKIKFITQHRKLLKQVVNRVIIKNPIHYPFLVWAVHAILISLSDVNRTICISTTCYNGPRIQSKDRMSQWRRKRSNAIKINPETYIICSLSATFRTVQIIFGGGHLTDGPNRDFIIRMYLFVP